MGTRSGASSGDSMTYLTSRYIITLIELACLGEFHIINGKHR